MKHGISKLASVLRDAEDDKARRRLSKRQQRTWNRLQRRLDRYTLEGIRAGLIKSITSAELICDEADLALMTCSDLGQQTGLGKLLGWMSNRLRRDRELLLLVEAQLNPHKVAAPSFIVLPAPLPASVDDWTRDFAPIAERGQDAILIEAKTIEDES